MPRDGQMGKGDKQSDMVVLDFSGPFSPLTAFGYALALLELANVTL